MSKRILILTILIVIVIAVFLGVKKTGNAVHPALSDRPVRASAQHPANQVSAHSLLSQARQFEAKGTLLEAKNVYQKLVNDFPESPDVAGWQKRLEDINIKLLFSSVITPKSIAYQIRPGDTLNKIAREHKTTAELIMKSNNISDSFIVPGRKLKVWTAPFSILIDKSQNILMLKSGEDIIKTYTVSTGANNCTPLGTFKIVNKLLNPTWFKAGAVVEPGSPENILGSRWLGLSISGYGIHGTTEPQGLGKQATQGCVRMANPEVEELYAIVPEGTEVVIID